MSDEILQDEVNSWGNEDEAQVQYRYLRLKRSEKGTKLKDYALGDLVVIADKEPVGVLPKGENGKTEIIILEINLGRRLQSAYAPNKNRVLFCRSNDRVTPVTDDNRFTPKAASCASCAHGAKAWANYKTTKQKPANPCEQTAEVVFALASDPETVFILNFERDREVAEELLTSLRAKSKAAVAQLNRRPQIFEFIVAIDSATNEKDQWEPTFEFVGLLVEEEVQPFRDLYVYRKERQKLYEAEQVQQSADAAVEQVQQQQIVEEIVPAPAVAAATATRPTYTPPVSRRVAGTRPTYTPPVPVVATPVPEVPAVAAPVYDDNFVPVDDDPDDIPF